MIQPVPTELDQAPRFPTTDQAHDSCQNYWKKVTGRVIQCRMFENKGQTDRPTDRETDNITPALPSVVGVMLISNSDAASHLVVMSFEKKDIQDRHTDTGRQTQGQPDTGTDIEHHLSHMWQREDDFKFWYSFIVSGHEWIDPSCMPRSRNIHSKLGQYHVY